MKYTLVVSLLFLSNACGQQKDSHSSIKDSYIPTPAQTSKAVLGKGYDIERQTFVGDCVKGNIQYVGAPESTINFDRSLSQTEIAESLGFSIGGKARFGAVKYSAAAKFASSSTANSYSEATVYSADYRFKNAKLDYTGLTEVGKIAKQGSGPYVWENWKKTCGNEYVEQVELGAKLFISAKVDFSTKEDKQAFSAQFKIKGPAFSASGELKKASRSFGKSASVSIRAYQFGGDVSRLSAIFKKKAHGETSSEENRVHALLICSMENIDACVEILDSALKYATDTDDPNAFPNQIRPTLDPTKPEGPAELAYITKPWSALAFYPPLALIAAGVEQARKELSFMFEENLALRERVNALLTGPFRLSLNQRNRVDAIEKSIARNLARVNDGAEICYAELDKCRAKVAEVTEKMEKIDENQLAIYPEIFSQWCDAYQAGIVKKTAFNTVKALVDEASRLIDLTKVGDLCGTAERVLVEKKELTLTRKEISSLEPIITLSHLKALNLSYNAEISDFSPLSGLSKLEDLNLSGNRLNDLDKVASISGLTSLTVAHTYLRSLSGIEKLTNLERLNIGDNHLTNINQVSSLAKLRTLTANNTRISSVAPLQGLTSLESLDLSFNTIGDFSPLMGLTKLIYLDVSENLAGCPPPFENICVVPM